MPGPSQVKSHQWCHPSAMVLWLHMPMQDDFPPGSAVGFGPIRMSRFGMRQRTISFLPWAEFGAVCVPALALLLHRAWHWRSFPPHRLLKLVLIAGLLLAIISQCVKSAQELSPRH